MADNKVNVRIYGQDYTVSGERDEETIVAIANYVDSKIREISQFFSSTQPGSLATLAAVNIADEFFLLKDSEKLLREENIQLSKDVEHYVNLWEEVKRSFTQYKENALKATEQIKEWEEKLKRAEAKCAEFESAYFDLQMENIQLKDRIEKMER